MLMHLHSSGASLDHDREAKSLLALVQYLKAKYVRESGLRLNLAQQKLYLNSMLRHRQEMCDLYLFCAFKSAKTMRYRIDSTSSVLSRYGLPTILNSPPPLQRANKLKKVAVAVRFVVRLQYAWLLCFRAHSDSPTLQDCTAQLGKSNADQTGAARSIRND